MHDVKCCGACGAAGLAFVAVEMESEVPTMEEKMFWQFLTKLPAVSIFVPTIIILHTE